ncbi:unnamed protein product [Oppiella nova]|uniref:ribonuclease H n=1 Tax=Oppiella nova TaxID=334625 RepID=A0A7R9M8N7_9ACAR|nr:unnamed protein product [Oppiella nova]CAG2172533.1 unnamed protein product [Oppiella nova]
MPFYAVKEGRVPGVYSTWSECKRQTDGYIGSEFKSFNKVEDALAYMKGKSSSRSNYGTYHETYYETNYETSHASAYGLGHGLAPPVTYGSTQRSHYRAHCRAGYAEASGVGSGGSRSVRSIGSPPKSAISTMRDIPKTAIEWLPKRVTTTQYQTNDGMNVVVKEEFKALQKASKGKVVILLRVSISLSQQLIAISFRPKQFHFEEL